MKHAIVIGILCACSLQPGDNGEKAASKFTTPFFPQAKGNKWVYRQGQDRVVYEVIGHSDHELKSALPSVKPGDAISRIVVAHMRISNGQKSVVEKLAVSADGVYRVCLAGLEYSPPVCFLKLRKEKDQWECNAKAEGIAVTGTFVSAKERITIRGRTYDAIKAGCANLQAGNHALSVHYWIVKDIGMVKQVVVRNPGQANEETVTLELESYTPGKPKKKSLEVRR